MAHGKNDSMALESFVIGQARFCAKKIVDISFFSAIGLMKVFLIHKETS